ncbi:MAG: Ku protein [Cryobacterium sp.]|nr:Ku protein [Oligoflexia bacterium]
MANRKKSATKRSPKRTSEKISENSSKKSKGKSARTPNGHEGGRSLWTGSLSFGLLNIPVSLGSAKEEADLSFQLLDKRDYGHIGYRQYNKSTGKEVPRGKIVKGYEYESGKYVVVTDEDFRRANPRAVSTIDIEDFVEYKEMDPMLFDTPYYLRPAKNGEKGYRLLRDVMRDEGKVAIGRVVLFRKQRLVAVLVRGDYLVLEMLRFDREIFTADEMASLVSQLSGVKISPKELDMARALVNGMTSDWDPNKYEDTYQAELLALIQAKAKKGGVEALDSPNEEPEALPQGKVVNLMPLLKKSLELGRKDKKSAKLRA